MYENIRGKAVYDNDKRQKLIFVIALYIQVATVLNNSVAPMYICSCKERDIHVYMAND